MDWGCTTTTRTRKTCGGSSTRLPGQLRAGRWQVVGRGSGGEQAAADVPVSYTHLRAHETEADL
eukprot:2724222-Rhodomonas_salina.1